VSRSGVLGHSVVARAVQVVGSKFVQVCCNRDLVKHLTSEGIIVLLRDWVHLLNHIPDDSWLTGRVGLRAQVLPASVGIDHLQELACVHNEVESIFLFFNIPLLLREESFDNL